MEKDKKLKTVVISGINIVDGGAKSVFDDLLDTIVSVGENKKYNIVVLVAHKSLFKKYREKLTLIEFPKSKKHWLNRVYYEYFYFKKLSKKLKPYIWLSMHDITPNVVAERRYVYCHNPSPFYSMPIKDIKYGWKYYLFSKFYKYLYKINIKKNNAVIVQQQWMGEAFRRMYKIKNVVIARPNINTVKVPSYSHKNNDKYTFIYPSYPRVFKNFELACEAAKVLYDNGIKNFQLLITLDGKENNYSKYLFEKYSYLPVIKFIGLLPREDLIKEYGKADCLIFTSELETWGMPLTEFIQTQKPIITVNLPYAYETIGNYRNVAFVNASDSRELAKLMKKAIMNNSFNNSKKIKNKVPDFVYVDGWRNLFNLITENRNNNRDKFK